MLPVVRLWRQQSVEARYRHYKKQKNKKNFVFLSTWLCRIAMIRIGKSICLFLFLYLSWDEGYVRQVFRNLPRPSSTSFSHAKKLWSWFICGSKISRDRSPAWLGSWRWCRPPAVRSPRALCAARRSRWEGLWERARRREWKGASRERLMLGTCSGSPSSPLSHRCRTASQCRAGVLPGAGARWCRWTWCRSRPSSPSGGDRWGCTCSRRRMASSWWWGVWWQAERERRRALALAVGATLLHIILNI